MQFCCDQMRSALEARCDVHPDRSDCPDALVTFNEHRRTFGLLIHDGGSSAVTIHFCPWCGSDLRVKTDPSAADR